MWLFVGRYAQFGPIICAMAIAALVFGASFLFIAVRLFASKIDSRCCYSRSLVFRRVCFGQR